MRWTLNVNQKQSLYLGIKNINQSIILGLICECHSWAEAILIDGQVFYWTSRQSFAKELPLLDLKADTIYRHLKTLEQLGLIEYKKDGKKDCVRLTKLGKSYYVGNEYEFNENSEMNPTKLGNESENNSEMNPTYNNTNSYPITSNKNIVVFDENSHEKVVIEEVIKFLNHMTGANYRSSTPKTKKLIQARIKEGFNLNDFYSVIEKKTVLWKNDPKMQAYLRPETLFGDKFEGYLNQIVSDYDKAKAIQEHTGMSPSETLDIQLQRAQEEWENTTKV